VWAYRSGRRRSVSACIGRSEPMGLFELRDSIGLSYGSHKSRPVASQTYTPKPRHADTPTRCSRPPDSL
jgi:hypothetical protein